VIVDSGSTDGTRELVEYFISQGWSIHFMHQDWLGYAAQKQFALEQCTQPWCLSLDADERLDDELQASLGELLDVPSEVAGWRLARRPYLYGYGYVPRNVREGRILRLIRRGRGAFDLTKWVHEGILPDGEVKISTRGSLLHFRALPIEEQILKENNYSTLKADMLLSKGQGPRYIRMFFNPPLYFIRLYFTYGLWRCRMPGFIHAMTGAVYSFLTEVKIYQRNALEAAPNVDNLDRIAA
jgi:glycosyltransferase involved in cell wall biosynthesis